LPAGACPISMRLINRFCAGLALLAAIACNDTATDTLEPNGVWSLSSIWSGQIVIAEIPMLRNGHPIR
jgi:hypothetical protein